MKINTKIIFLIIGSLVLSFVIYGLLSTWQLNRGSDLAVSWMKNLSTDNMGKVKGGSDKLRQELMAQKRNFLQAQVQTTMGVIEKAYKDAHSPEKLKEMYREPLQNAVNTAFGILVKIEKEQGLSLEEKQAKAATLIKSLRYGPKNKDYFWINDIEPRMVMHPYKPNLDGKDLSKAKDPNGKRLFVEFANVCREKGEGFVDYAWPKYGSDKPQPKLSFVKLFKKWNWIVGTGVYLEVSEEKLKADAIAIIEALRYGPENKDYFWINDMEPRMVMHPYKPKLNGKSLSGVKDPKGKRLFVEFVNVCNKKGEGFVDYYWPKYGSDEPQPKLSFVKLFKQWNWVIGTGMYIDDVNVIVETREKELAQRMEAVAGMLQEKVETAEKEIRSNVRQSSVTGGLFFLVILGVVVVVSIFFIKKQITSPINNIIEGLNDGADHVAHTSAQVSSSSHQLADGASNQAASIEETSSSLEEMASMTSQNAKNAGQADQLMKETNQIVDRANDSMDNLTISMDEITKASEETSKIVKTIDEIAFQTNLLALNAAVEAARAGEAGAGFAVVADEVRNLSMRAAEAAKSTGELIDSTVEKVNAGTVILTRTNQDFDQVSESSKKVGALVGEISSASNEQAEGINQVNKAIAEMDSVVQQNLSNVEESASAAEKMNTQSEEMKASVSDLINLVGGDDHQ